MYKWYFKGVLVFKGIFKQKRELYDSRRTLDFHIYPVYANDVNAVHSFQQVFIPCLSIWLF